MLVELDLQKKYDTLLNKNEEMNTTNAIELCSKKTR